MRRSVTVFPDLAAKEVSAIVETRKQYAKAFNMSVDCLVTNNSTSKRFLHKVQYERIREECPTLPTGLIQCARDVAVEAVKAWNVKRTKLKRKHPKKAERMRRPSMKEKCTMRYDVRTVTLRGSQLTFSTCGRRVKAIISIPGFFTERYPDSEGWKLKGANMGIDRKGRVFVNLIYECPDYDTVENDGRIVGLDRGVYNIVTTSDGVHYGAKDARRVKRKYNHVRSELQEKGTRSAKRRLKAISGCEKRFVHDQNHCISKKLANTDGDVSIYVLEDLSSMNMLRLRGKSNKTMRNQAHLQVSSQRHKGGVRRCALHEPEVLGMQDDRQGFEEGEQICLQALRQQHACRCECRHQHPRQLHHPGRAIRAGCSQSAVWMECHR